MTSEAYGKRVDLAVPLPSPLPCSLSVTSSSSPPGFGMFCCGTVSASTKGCAGIRIEETLKEGSELDSQPQRGCRHGKIKHRKRKLVSYCSDSPSG